MKHDVEARPGDGVAADETKSGFGDGGSAILRLLSSDLEWVANGPIVDALGIVNTRGNHSLTGHWRDSSEWLGADTKLERGTFAGAATREVRTYSKRGIVKAALRARTDNARAFQQRAADIISRAIGHPDFADLFNVSASEGGTDHGE